MFLSFPPCVSYIMRSTFSCLPHLLSQCDTCFTSLTYICCADHSYPILIHSHSINPAWFLRCLLCYAHSLFHLCLIDRYSPPIARDVQDSLFSALLLLVTSGLHWYFLPVSYLPYSPCSSLPTHYFPCCIPALPSCPSSKTE